MEIIYDLIIRPLELLLDVVYTLFYRYLESPGYAIIGVSLAVGFLTLPLYRRADAIQKAQRDKEAELKRWIDHINTTFHGDERYMRAAAYYRSMDYHPIQSVRATFSLLLQIPFFVAAYHYLSNLTMLNGYTFGPFRDLGAEDAMFMAGNFPINILPIVMTLINFISAMIYTKDMMFRDKLQPYLLAIIFLVLLYHSPSGLVFYWTFNNIFSLCKNIVLSYCKDKKKLAGVIAGAAGIINIVILVSKHKVTDALEKHDLELAAAYILITVFLFLPILKNFIKRKISWTREVYATENRAVLRKDFFILSGSMVLFLGAVIPLTVVASSPLDFVNVFYYKNPTLLALSVLLVMSGTFLIWGGIIYKLMDENKRKTFLQIIFGLLIVFIFNYFSLDADTGTYTKILRFDRIPSYPAILRYTNIFIDLAIYIVACRVWNRHRKYARSGLYVLLIVVIVFSGRQAMIIHSKLQGLYIDTKESRFSLSRNGRNVIIIMLDRAIGAYIPFILDEKPELVEKYDGFTFYPNTVSTGLNTNTGSPALFGGYEYTSQAINERDTETLADKHNEALQVMPILFGENGWDVTVSDVPYAGYKDISDYSIYENLDYVYAFPYGDQFEDGGSPEEVWSLMKRNLFFYSIYKIAPAILQDNIYDNGNYISGDSERTWYGSLKAQYLALDYLKEYTEISENGNSMIMYGNTLPHNPDTLLQLPDYKLVDHVDNSLITYEIEREINGIHMDMKGTTDLTVEHYHVNMASILLLGEYFDFLRQEGIYDNSRIILVADHGRALGQFKDMILADGFDVESVNALLMVKDFNSKGFRIDDTFMANADVPAIALAGIVEHPVNPFTGNEILQSKKANGIDIFATEDWGVREGNTFSPSDAPVYHIHDNIFDLDNWERIQ